MANKKPRLHWGQTQTSARSGSSYFQQKYDGSSFLANKFLLLSNKMFSGGKNLQLSPFTTYRLEFHSTASLFWKTVDVHDLSRSFRFESEWPSAVDDGQTLITPKLLEVSI